MNSAKASLATQQAVVETFLKNYDEVCNNHFSSCTNKMKLKAVKFLEIVLVLEMNEVVTLLLMDVCTVRIQPCCLPTRYCFYFITKMCSY